MAIHFYRLQENINIHSRTTAYNSMLPCVQLILGTVHNCISLHQMPKFGDTGMKKKDAPDLHLELRICTYEVGS